MTRNELIQLHIDRLIHYEEYESAYLKFINQFPLVETHEGIYSKLEKPKANVKPNERKSSDIVHRKPTKRTTNL